MRKLFFVFVLLIGVTTLVMGQERTKKILELKIGLSVSGYVMELENGNYMLETDAGDIVFYNRDEIRSIHNPGEESNGTEAENKSKKTDPEIVSNSRAAKNPFESLLLYYGIKEKLDDYRKALYAKNEDLAEEIEDELWEIEKMVKSDSSIPESVRKDFVKYIESTEDDIEKDAKRNRRRR